MIPSRPDASWNPLSRRGSRASNPYSIGGSRWKHTGETWGFVWSRAPFGCRSTNCASGRGSPDSGDEQSRHQLQHVGSRFVGSRPGLTQAIARVAIRSFDDDGRQRSRRRHCVASSDLPNVESGRAPLRSRIHTPERPQLPGADKRDTPIHPNAQARWGRLRHSGATTSGLSRSSGRATQHADDRAEALVARLPVASPATYAGSPDRACPDVDCVHGPAVELYHVDHGMADVRTANEEFDTHDARAERGGSGRCGCRR
jgi:hypothetical protein